MWKGRGGLALSRGRISFPCIPGMAVSVQTPTFSFVQGKTPEHIPVVQQIQRVH